MTEDRNEIEAAIRQSTPSAEALRNLLRGVLGEAVMAVANGLYHNGIDPTTMPAEYFIQAALVEAEKMFIDIPGQQAWNDIYATYLRINAVMAANPELKELRKEILKNQMADPDVASVQTPDLSESEEVEAFLRDVFGEGK